MQTNEKEIKKIKLDTIKECYNDRHEHIFKPFIKNVLEKGFKVYSNANLDNFSYIIVQGQNRLIYIQKAYFSGLDFSTKHKPNRNTGTGHRVIAEGNPSIENLNHVLNTNFKDETYFKDLNDYVLKVKYYKLSEFVEVVL
jgi:hypothetical protein